MEQSKIYDKIKKLLSLSTSPNEHEAQAAMLKAQELMAKYDIQVESVNAEITYIAEMAETDGNNAFRIPLGSVIAPNFRCEIFMRGTDILFYGHPEDVKICKEVYEFAYKSILKLSRKRYNQARTAGYDTRGFYTNYQNGFIIALKNAFAKQCTALMIVTPEDVKSSFKEMTDGWSKRKAQTRNMGFNANAYLQGAKDGKEFAKTM